MWLAKKGPENSFTDRFPHFLRRARANSHTLLQEEWESPGEKFSPGVALGVDERTELWMCACGLTAGGHP